MFSFGPQRNGWRPLVGIVAVFGLAACGPTMLQQGKQAYALGKLTEARRALLAVSPSEASEYSEAQELLGHLREEATYAAKELIAQAEAFEKASSTQPWLLMDALERYRAALEVMPFDDARRQPLEHQAARIEGELGQRTAAYEMDLATARVLAKKHSWSELAPLLEKLADARDVVRRADGLAAIAREAATVAYSNGQHADSLRLAELADALWIPSEKVHADVLRLAALAAFRTGGQLSTPKKPPETALAAASAAPTPAPASPSETRQAKRTPKGSGSSASNATAVASLVAEVSEALEDARRTFAEGNLHLAFVTLDRALERYKTAPNATELAAQREAWQGQRDTLVKQYLARGEEAFSREDSETAYEWYVKAAALAPDNRIAIDRMRKIERLRQLKGQQ